jgi:transposase
MVPLSIDLRQRIIRAWQKERLTTEALAELFNVGVATVTRLKRRYRDTQSVYPKPHAGGHPRRISKENEPQVERLVQAHPDWTEAQYAQELQTHYGIRASAVTVGRVIRKLGYSVKKRPSLPKKEIEQLSSSDEENTSNKSKTLPLRVWYLWTKRARTSP